MASPHPIQPNTDTPLRELPGREGAKLAEFENEVRAIFVDMMHNLGLPKSYGDIYGILYATPEPLAFAEIQARLSLSKGSVSGGLKALREIGAVKSSTRAKDRREVFAPELELKKLMRTYMEERIRPQLDANISRMKQLDQFLENAVLSPGPRKILESRLNKLAKWRQRATGLIPWILRFLG